MSFTTLISLLSITRQDLFNLITDIYRCKQIGSYFQPSDTIWFITYLSHLTMIINSSINFIIYCLIGKRFRKEMFQCFNLSSSAYIEKRVKTTTSLFAKQISEISTITQLSQTACKQSLAMSSKSVSMEDKESQNSEDEFSKLINVENILSEKK